MSTTVLIDYGAGNLRSVANALQSLDADVLIVSSAAEFPANPARVILPGVGSFGDSMEELCRRGLDEPVRRCLSSGVPFLGICVGYQMLFDSSEESPGIPGLGILKGQVKRFLPGKKVPHMGWNSTALTHPDHPCWAGLDAEPYFYFVHSYFPVPEEPSIIAAVTEYEEKFAAAVIRDHLWAVQFHPEKSQDSGLQLIRNFLQQSAPASCTI
ncbi:MAG TPA: imidazole glycerol phosphate synthase subunit HisH [Verrucomicrobiales bacterium]|jgi:glutamine amidotransferase|nr:MAG: imidazole glycerol phosphate synthase subunit HisH [Verrucomicrobiae bacterium Tous-C3TDCM]PAZ04027.1 MAG: imidazole glycerol phosphate synthase subunit HisH [Verrucomicrobiae bacterium AMD-G2]HBE22626.1 imidazole glycerol phosphate synthase subunit HisH [Verrucomicrobiales bacterium]